jgi:hypothetical protein
VKFRLSDYNARFWILTAFIKEIYENMRCESLSLLFEPSFRLSAPCVLNVNSEHTVRWSNFQRRDPKVGIFLKSTEATPWGYISKWKLTPENPPVDTMSMAAIAMVLLWKIAEDFQSFVKNTKLWASKIWILQENGFKELKLVLFESLFLGLHILFNKIFGQTIYWSTAKPRTSPKKTFKWPWKIKF